MNSLPETVTRQRRGCDLNPGPSAFQSSTITTRLPSHSTGHYKIGLQIGSHTVPVKRNHQHVASCLKSPGAASDSVFGMVVWLLPAFGSCCIVL